MASEVIVECRKFYSDMCVIQKSRGLSVIMRISRAVVLILMGGGVPLAKAQDAVEEPVVEYHEELERRIFQYEVVLSEVTKSITELEEAYEGQLEKIKEICMQRGSLDDALLVQKEIDGFRNGESVVSERNVAELRRARNTFENELQRRKRQLESAVQEVEKRHIDNLKAYQAELTRGQRLDYALEVKAYIEGFIAVPIVEAPKIELFWLPNFEGESVVLEVPVEIDRFARRPDLQNDKLHSIRIPDGVVVTISNGPDLESPRKTLTKDAADLDTGTSSLRARVSGLGPR